MKRRDLLKGIFGGAAAVALGAVGVKTADAGTSDAAKFIDASNNFACKNAKNNRLTSGDIDELVDTTLKSLKSKKWSDISRQTEDFGKMTRRVKVSYGKYPNQVCESDYDFADPKYHDHPNPRRAREMRGERS